MTNRQVYKKAAKMISNRESHYVCFTLDRLNSCTISFRNIFEPKDLYSKAFFFDEPLPNLEFSKDENRLARSLALLFMAEMEE